MAENPSEDIEARKQAGLEKLLAEGFRRADLIWFPPREYQPGSMPAGRKVNVVPADPKDPEFVEDRRALARFKEERCLGTWGIKGEAITRRLREEIAAIFNAARDALLPRWPREANEVHDALIWYARRYDDGLSDKEAEALLARVDRIAGELPPDAANIVRLAKLSYVGERKHHAELFEACRRMTAGGDPADGSQ